MNLVVASLPASTMWDEYWRHYADYRLTREPWLIDQWLRDPSDWLSAFERQLEAALSPKLVDWSDSGFFSNGFCSWATHMRLV